MGKHSDMMNEFGNKSKPQNQSTNNKCWHHGCPMKASVRSPAGKECAFHFGQEGRMHSHITQAIHDNMKHIEDYKQLVSLSGNALDASNSQSPIHSITLIRMNDGELPSRFVSRFYTALLRHINNEATSMAMGVNYND